MNINNILDTKIDKFKKENAHMIIDIKKENAILIKRLEDKNEVLSKEINGLTVEIRKLLGIINIQPLYHKVQG